MHSNTMKDWYVWAAIVMGVLFPVLAVIAFSYVLYADERSWRRYGHLAVQVRQLCVHLEHYRDTHGTYPEDLGALEPAPHPYPGGSWDTVEELQRPDPWKSTIEYRSDGAHYLMWSRGADGATDSEWPVGRWKKAESWRDTVLFDGGSFLFHEGIGPDLSCIRSETPYSERVQAFRAFERKIRGSDVVE